MIPYGKQSIVQSDIDAVVNVLTSDFLTQGPKVPEFENAVATYCNAKHAVAVNSATSALHIACLALNVGKGDIVWTSPISFVASSNCAIYCGADIDFVDIDVDTGNMSTNLLSQKLVNAQAEGKLPKVVIPVHLAGQSCDMEEIYKLSKRYNFKIIEDASHAIGASYQSEKVGCCQFSDITIFSFHPVKIVTSAEGGMALTNCQRLARKMQKLRSHGITNLPDEMTEPSHGPWYYQQTELGFNYRMTELQAALGLSQLKQLDDFVKRRNELTTVYLKLLNTHSILHLKQSDKVISAYHLFVIQLEDKYVARHREIFEKLRSAGIFCQLHYIPIHLQPYYQNLGFKKNDYPNAEAYYQRSMSLPLFPDLKESEIEYICTTLNKLLD
jgi:UDP-4-amino-4,6-dideoxy-N-acetyl-beta-L-altrosamine transaminase